MKHDRILTLFLAGALCASLQPVFGGDLKLTETDDEIRVTLRGKPVLEYVKTERPVPDGIEPYYRRSGYIHPVYTPTGQEISGDFPADHAHQHALFFAWTKAGFDGKEVDFWNQAKDLGRVEFREVLDLTRADRQVSFRVKHAFMVGTDDKSVDVLSEVWTVTVYQTDEDHFLFDVVSVQECVTDKPLNIAKYRYGGMAFRGNDEWLKEKEDHSIEPGDLEFLTSEGKDRWEGNHTRPDWVAFSGRIDSQNATAAIFGSPKNFRAPQSVRIHPNKPYFCFAPMVDGPFQIEPGKPYVSRYRFLITSDSLDEDLIGKHWIQYSESEK